MRNPFKREPKVPMHESYEDHGARMTAELYRKEWERLYGVMSVPSVRGGLATEVESITKSLRVLRLSDGSFVPVIPGQRYLVATGVYTFAAVAHWSPSLQVVEFVPMDPYGGPAGRAAIDYIQAVT